MSKSAPPKKRRPSMKMILIVATSFVLLFICLYCYWDKPAKWVQTTDPNGANPEKGEIVDYRYLFDAAQEKEFGVPEENGWRLILQAFGPRALEQSTLADLVPWEEFPANEMTKEWFHGQWSSLCEKFKLDPYARPTMLDRLDLWTYVCKNGLVGDEPEPNPDEMEDFYYENGERRPCKISEYRAQTILMIEPWTAEEYPVAARWIEENADFYDVFVQAARSPKLRRWRFVPDVKDDGFIATPLADVQAIRGFARLFATRANYRVGSGDISGAIDDVETITLFGRALLDSSIGSYVERLVGLALLNVANGVPLFGNPSVAPTEEELARIAELKASDYRNGNMERARRRADDGERFIFGYGGYADYLASRRLGKDAYDSLFSLDDDSPRWSKASRLLFFRAPPVNDAKSFQFFKELCDSAFDDDANDVLKDVKKHPLLSVMTSSPERNNAIYHFTLMAPRVQPARYAFARAGCAAQIAAITTAFYAYRAEHGTAPPAYTVDENGTPLHSWRVLLLPYLGDEAKALHDKLRLDEPWDSEHNAAFHAQIPDVFRCPLAKDAKDGETVYSLLLDHDGLFDDSGKGKDFLEMAGQSVDHDVLKQFLVVERAAPVCWMTPDQEIRKDAPNLRQILDDRRHYGYMNYSTAKGVVGFLPLEAEPILNELLHGLPRPQKIDGE